MAPWGPDLCGGLWDNELARKQNALSVTLSEKSLGLDAELGVSLLNVLPF